MEYEVITKSTPRDIKMVQEKKVNKRKTKSQNQRERVRE